MVDMDKIRLKIEQDIINGEDWTNPYLLDEVKEEFPETSEEVIDGIYLEELKAKVGSFTDSGLRALLEEQGSETSANQNYLLQNLIEERLNLLPSNHRH